MVDVEKTETWQLFTERKRVPRARVCPSPSHMEISTPDAPLHLHGPCTLAWQGRVA